MSQSMTKPTKSSVCPLKASSQSDQSSLDAWRRFGPLAIQQAHSEGWSDWVDAQAGLSLCWVHRSFCLLYPCIESMGEGGWVYCFQVVHDSLHNTFLFVTDQHSWPTVYLVRLCTASVYFKSLISVSGSRLFGSVVKALNFCPGEHGLIPTRVGKFFSCAL